MPSLIVPEFKDDLRFYRDDRVAASQATPREIGKTKQEVSSVFKSDGLKITIEAIKKVVKVLHVTFDFSSRIHEAKQQIMTHNKRTLIFLFFET